MTLNNIVTGATHFEIAKTNFFSEFNVWVRQTTCHQQFMESDSETYDMALDNIVIGATHFELAKMDVGGPIYSHLGHKFKNDALKKPSRQDQYMAGANAIPPAVHIIRIRNL